MRKQFASTVRVVSVPKAVKSASRLSLEEEFLILDQANKNERDVDEGLDEANRMTELSDALEDLAVVVSEIKEATPTEIALIGNAAQMGVAGTSNEPELLMPAMESLQEGKSIAAESFAEKAKAIMKNILEFIARLWEKIVAFYRVNVIVKELRTRLRGMIEKIKSGGVVKNFTPAKTVGEIDSWYSYNGKILSSADEIREGIVDTIKMAKFVFEDYPNQIAHVGTQIDEKLRNFQPANSEQSLKGMVEALNQLDFEKMPGAKQVKEDGEFEVFESQAFIGRGKLVARVYRVNTPNEPYADLDRVRNSGIKLEHNDEHNGSVINTTQQSVGLPGVMQILDHTDNLLGVVEMFHEKHVKNLKHIADNLKESTKKAAHSFETADEEVDGEAQRDFKAAVNFNTAFARWSQQPTMPFYSMMIRVAKFAMAYSHQVTAHHAA